MVYWQTDFFPQQLLRKSSVDSLDQLDRPGEGGGAGGGWSWHKGRFSKDYCTVISGGGSCEYFWYGQRCPLFDVVHPTFHLPITASPTLPGALKEGFGEAVVACDMSEPCKFSSFDSCWQRFLWTHKEVGHALHPVVGLVLQLGDAEKFLQAFRFENLDFFQSQEAGSMFHGHRGGWR